MSHAPFRLPWLLASGFEKGEQGGGTETREHRSPCLTHSSFAKRTACLHLCKTYDARCSYQSAASGPKPRPSLLEPDGDRLNITLKGDLAGMLSAARDSKRSPETGDLLVQIKLVAGARNQRYLQLWCGAA